MARRNAASISNWQPESNPPAPIGVGTIEREIMIRVIFNRILGGWFIVRGPHQTPIGGRFNTRAEALAHLRRGQA